MEPGLGDILKDGDKDKDKDKDKNGEKNEDKDKEEEGGGPLFDTYPLSTDDPGPEIWFRSYNYVLFTNRTGRISPYVAVKTDIFNVQTSNWRALDSTSSY